jgi:hypothetical protein
MQRRVVLWTVGVAAALLGAAARADVFASGDTITFEGRIEASSAAKFLELLTPDIKRLVITSRGGLVAPALDMAEAIAARGLDVEVPEDCLSSCANYIFPAGRRKTLGWRGAVAWHGNMTHILYLSQTTRGASGDAGSAQGPWTEAQLADARNLAQRENAFFRRIGVDGYVCWFGKVSPYEVPGFYYLSVQDMRRFGIADVTVQSGGPPQDPEGLERVMVDERALAMRPAVPQAQAAP